MHNTSRWVAFIKRLWWLTFAQFHSQILTSDNIEVANYREKKIPQPQNRFNRLWSPCGCAWIVDDWCFYGVHEARIGQSLVSYKSNLKLDFQDKIDGQEYFGSRCHLYFCDCFDALTQHLAGHMSKNVPTFFSVLEPGGGGRNCMHISIKVYSIETLVFSRKTRNVLKILALIVSRFPRLHLGKKIRNKAGRSWLSRRVKYVQNIMGRLSSSNDVTKSASRHRIIWPWGHHRRMPSRSSRRCPYPSWVPRQGVCCSPPRCRCPSGSGHLQTSAGLFGPACIGSTYPLEK